MSLKWKDFLSHTDSFTGLWALPTLSLLIICKNAHYCTANWDSCLRLSNSYQLLLVSAAISRVACWMHSYLHWWSQHFQYLKVAHMSGLHNWVRFGMDNALNVHLRKKKCLSFFLSFNSSNNRSTSKTCLVFPQPYALENLIRKAFISSIRQMDGLIHVISATGQGTALETPGSLRVSLGLTSVLKSCGPMFK